MWKKKECRRRKIKNSGRVDFVVGLLLVFVVTVVMLVCQQIAGLMIAGAYVEDAVAASNLASALIDVDLYGREQIIRIFHPQEAYHLYKEALSINLQLDEEGRAFQKELLAGPIKIEDYRIYNVAGDQVEIYVLSKDEMMQSDGWIPLEGVVTPDGTIVETTTIYSKIQFSVSVFGNNTITTKKEKSVDVKRNEEE